MRKGTCKHFNGVQHKHCRAGVNIREITGGDARGWITRMPCMIDNHASMTCALYTEPTDEDLSKDSKWIDDTLRKMEKAGPLIRELKHRYADQDWSGYRECPICGGVLQLSISGYNGHVHGRCETPDCLNWKE